MCKAVLTVFLVLLKETSILQPKKAITETQKPKIPKNAVLFFFFYLNRLYFFLAVLCLQNWAEFTEFPKSSSLLATPNFPSSYHLALV